MIPAIGSSVGSTALLPQGLSALASACRYVFYRALPCGCALPSGSCLDLFHQLDLAVPTGRTHRLDLLCRQGDSKRNQ